MFAVLFPVFANPALAGGITVVKVDHAPVTDPASALWEKAAATDVAVMPQTLVFPKNPTATVHALHVRALADDAWLALRIEWDDATRDQQVEVDKFTDAVAIELPLGDANATSPMMGDPKHPVYILHWKGVWQADVEHGHADVQDYHPGYYTDAYPFATGERPYPVDTSFQTSDARRYFVGTSAGNPVSQLAREWPVEELQAKGFGTLATQALQDAEGTGVYASGHWSVVLALPRSGHDAENPRLGPGSQTKVAFAVWDGGARNVGGRKHWYPFIDVVLP